MNEKVEPVDQSDEWKQFHLNNVNGNYPKWHSEAILQSTFTHKKIQRAWPLRD